MKWSETDELTKNDNRWATAEKRHNRHCDKEQTVKLKYKRARRNYIKRQFIFTEKQRLV